MPWNLEELRDLICAAQGEARSTECWSSLQSIVQRQTFAGYHFGEYKRLIESRFPEGRTLQQEWTDALGFGEEAWANHTAETQAEAHVVACLQNMHCVSDTLGHVVYLALGPHLGDLGKLGDRGSSIEGVRRVLVKSNVFPALARKLDELCDHDDFRHLSDLVNHSKHRRIVPLSILVEAPDGEMVKPRLELPAFDHNGKAHGPRDVQSALNAEYGRQSELVVEIGCVLNREVLDLIGR